MTHALDLTALPCAHGGPAGRARLRAEPEDFVVHEWLGFDADGEGDHWLLTVRKRGANTHWVAKQLAKLAQIHVRDVGFAGLKDRDAVTQQAFTVPVRCAVEHWDGVSGEGFAVVSAQRQRRKLKRGALRGNDFELRLREFTGDAALLQERVHTIAAHGVPNYFGPQRFGRDGSNLAAATAWFGGGRPPSDRLVRGFALSAARAAIFNAIVARRVAEGSWDRLQSGDVANLQGSGSVFAVAEVDDALAERSRVLDIHPTGPLWGRGATLAQGAVATLETEVAEHYGQLASGLAQEGLAMERRALRAQVGGLQCSVEGTDVRLKFRLSRGIFATAVLHELIADVFAQQMPEMED